MRRWVVDTSPLLFLAKLNRLDILKGAADEILAPPAVFLEVAARQDEVGRQIDGASRIWLTRSPVRDERLVEILSADLGAGEAEVIALAREVDAERVVLDDLDARRFARRIGLPAVGTLGLLLAARLRGEIPSLREEIERLRQSGFRASEALVREVLREAGELLE